MRAPAGIPAGTPALGPRWATDALALQRAVGNRALGRMLARTKTGPAGKAVLANAKVREELYVEYGSSPLFKLTDKALAAAGDAAVHALPEAARSVVETEARSAMRHSFMHRLKRALIEKVIEAGQEKANNPARERLALDLDTQVSALFERALRARAGVFDAGEDPGAARQSAEGVRRRVAVASAAREVKRDETKKQLHLALVAPLLEASAMDLLTRYLEPGVAFGAAQHLIVPTLNSKAESKLDDVLGRIRLAAAGTARHNAPDDITAMEFLRESEPGAKLPHASWQTYARAAAKGAYHAASAEWDAQSGNVIEAIPDKHIQMLGSALWKEVARRVSASRGSGELEDLAQSAYARVFESAGSVKSLLAKLAPVVRFATGSLGGSLEVSLEGHIPVHAGVNVDLGLSGSASGREGHGVTVQGRIWIGASGGLPAGLAFGGRIGGYVRAQAKTAAEALRLISYGIYRQLREDALVPGPLIDLLWGEGGLTAEGALQHEDYATEVKRLDKEHDDAASRRRKLIDERAALIAKERKGRPLDAHDAARLGSLNEEIDAEEYTIGRAAMHQTQLRERLAELDKIKQAHKDWNKQARAALERDRDVIGDDAYRARRERLREGRREVDVLFSKSAAKGDEAAAWADGVEQAMGRDDYVEVGLAAGVRLKGAAFEASAAAGVGTRYTGATIAAAHGKAQLKSRGGRMLWVEVGAEGSLPHAVHLEGRLYAGLFLNPDGSRKGSGSAGRELHLRGRFAAGFASPFIGAKEAPAKWASWAVLVIGFARAKAVEAKTKSHEKALEGKEAERLAEAASQVENWTVPEGGVRDGLEKALSAGGAKYFETGGANASDRRAALATDGRRRRARKLLDPDAIDCTRKRSAVRQQADKLKQLVEVNEILPPELIDAVKENRELVEGNLPAVHGPDAREAMRRLRVHLWRHNGIKGVAKHELIKLYEAYIKWQIERGAKRMLTPEQREALEQAQKDLESDALAVREDAQRRIHATLDEVQADAAAAARQSVSGIKPQGSPTASAVCDLLRGPDARLALSAVIQLSPQLFDIGDLEAAIGEFPDLRLKIPVPDPADLGIHLPRLAGIDLHGDLDVDVDFDLPDLGFDGTKLTLVSFEFVRGPGGFEGVIAIETGKRLGFDIGPMSLEARQSKRVIGLTVPGLKPILGYEPREEGLREPGSAASW